LLSIASVHVRLVRGDYPVAAESICTSSEPDSLAVSNSTFTTVESRQPVTTRTSPPSEDTSLVWSIVLCSVEKSILVAETCGGKVDSCGRTSKYNCPAKRVHSSRHISSHYSISAVATEVFPDSGIADGVGASGVASEQSTRRWRVLIHTSNVKYINKYLPNKHQITYSGGKSRRNGSARNRRRCLIRMIDLKYCQTDTHCKLTQHWIQIEYE
jgi:hypothetical protein